MTQQVIRFCEQCQSWRHITAFREGINYCLHCYQTMPYSTEGVIAPDGTVKDMEYQQYLMEPIIRARQGKSRERVETALPLRIDMGRFPARRPVKRKRR